MRKDRPRSYREPAPAGTDRTARARTASPPTSRGPLRLWGHDALVDPPVRARSNQKGGAG